MSTSNYTEFNLPRNAYAAFDAVSLKTLIINRLKESNLFPDVDYEGSNMSGLIDVIAYTYHVLLFYLNQTASESMFSQAELFENMNKIVSLIQYKPTGNSTSTLNFTATALADIPAPYSYTIRRFSSVSVKNVKYSFNSDITFQKTKSSVPEFIESIGKNNLLYQGAFKEYPLYTALGENFEQFSINVDYPADVGGVKYIDYNNVYVFVKDFYTQKWSEWKEISNLYLSDSITGVFEKKLNEYSHIQLKFGNNINGKRLNAGDKIAIYYLESDGVNGAVGSNQSKESSIVLYNTTQFSEIFNDIKDSNTVYIDSNLVNSLKLDNPYASVPFKSIETVEQIRQFAPLIFSAQNRAVTVYDYEAFVMKNFSNILQSVKAVSNKSYTTEYLSYFYNLGLERPNLDDKLLFNQVSFNDACDFNNVYLFCVPRLGVIINETTPIEMFYSQKQSIVDKLENVKMVTQNVVISDPVYMAFDIGLPLLNESVIPTSIRNDTVIRITRKSEQLLSKDQIKNSVLSLIQNFFMQSNNNLGQLMDFSKLSFDILNVNGVKSLETVRKDGNTEHKVSKLNFIYWNPLYPSSTVNTTAQNINLKYFEFPFFYQISNLVNKIEVI
jgi:hypothetical protein